MTKEKLAADLKAAEEAHATSGQPAEGWEAWYAAFLIQRWASEPK